MSSTVPALLQPMVAAETSTFAVCWKSTRQDGLVFGFTSHDRNLEVDSVDYAAYSGQSPTRMQWSAAMNVDNMEVTGFLDALGVTESDLLEGLWDYALVEVFYVNYVRPQDGIIKKVSGRFGQFKTGLIDFAAEMQGKLRSAQQTAGRFYQAGCTTFLGSDKCGVDVAALTVTGSLTSVTNRAVFFDSTRSEATDYFTAGKITFLTGVNEGQSLELKSYTQAGGAMVLQLLLPYEPQVGDTYSLEPGCLKRFQEDCKTKFNNGINHRGFNLIPKIDRLASGT